MKYSFEELNMKIVNICNYHFCNMCHLVSNEAVEFEISMVEESPRILLCKCCITQLNNFAAKIKE